MKKQTGFTLIELMIVVSIISILAAVVIPRINGGGFDFRSGKDMCYDWGALNNVRVDYVLTGEVSKSCVVFDGEVWLSQEAYRRQYTTREEPRG